MKKFALFVLFVAAVSTTSFGQTPTSTSAGTQPTPTGQSQPQYVGGGNPRPQYVGGGNPRPQSSLPEWVVAVLTLLNL